MFQSFFEEGNPRNKNIAEVAEKIKSNVVCRKDKTMVTKKC